MWVSPFRIYIDDSNTADSFVDGVLWDEWSYVSVLYLICQTQVLMKYCIKYDRRRLTMATIIFLPLTLLTGYFVSWLYFSLRTQHWLFIFHFREWISTQCGRLTRTPIYCMFYFLLFLEINSISFKDSGKLHFLWWPL